MSEVTMEIATPMGTLHWRVDNEFSRQPYKSIHLAPFLAPLIQASLSNRLTWQKYNGCSIERESMLRKSTEWANLTFTTPISSMDTNRIRIALIRKEKSLFRTYGKKEQRIYLNDHVQSCWTSNAIQNRILHQGVGIMWKRREGRYVKC